MIFINHLIKKIEYKKNKKDMYKSKNKIRMLSTTKVKNVKVVNIRPGFKDLKEWCEHPDNVYIGRRGIVFVDKKRYPTEDSIWCNPYKIGKDGDRDEVIQKYEIYIRNRLEKEVGLKDELKRLKDKNLGCWCAPEPCHGDVLIKLIQEIDLGI